MFEFLSNNFGNPSSIHSFGRKAKVSLEEARDICANFINADSSEYILQAAEPKQIILSLKEFLL